MTDALGNELNVGDKVIYVDCNYQNKFDGISTGVVKKICNFKVKIGNTSNTYFRWTRKIGANEIYKNPDRIIKM